MSEDGGTTYNLCHCMSVLCTLVLILTHLAVWSNFEIADMDFFRSPEYQAFFEYLDRKGGFYFERVRPPHAPFTLTPDISLHDPYS